VDIPIEPFDSLNYSEFEIVFSALPSSIAREYEKVLADSGKKVFSNASAYRYEPNVPIMIPEINSDHFNVLQYQDSYQNGGFIITNSNCTVSGLAIFLSSLKRIGVMYSDVIVSSYQALSGAGFNGLSSIPRDRVIPYIEKEEEKMEIEAKKILGTVIKKEIISDSSFLLLANCARVPVVDGHLESLTIKLTSKDEINKTKLIEKLSNITNPISHLPSSPNHHLIVFNGKKDRPQTPLDLYLGTKERAKGMAVVIGRIRISDNYLRCFLLVHNTIRGGAGGSILNAELALEKGYL
ncbi:MAG: aspartate-semialdehyde dehydrogenase, partial [Candidatus Heimdallarchaeota archaeon]